jgi:TetR/AcrR family transcriptional regulator, regulator of cefoperazone and chloramphenicol sensitivity
MFDTNVCISPGATAMTEKNRKDIPRERLLDEAEALFSEKGYNAVTVREISAAADCNLASINYYFGNKKNLYLEVFRDRWVPRARRVHEYFRQELGDQEPSSLNAVVKSLALAFLEGPLTDEERRRHHQLIARELAQPTEAFDLVAELVTVPFCQKLSGLLRPFMPPELTQEQVVLNILCIFAMVLYFNFARAAVSRLTDQEYDEAFKARLVEHLTGFSLTGLGQAMPAELKLGGEPQAVPTKI